jgi:hypothetical protein
MRAHEWGSSRLQAGAPSLPALRMEAYGRIANRGGVVVRFADSGFRSDAEKGIRERKGVKLRPSSANFHAFPAPGESVGYC